MSDKIGFAFFPMLVQISNNLITNFLFIFASAMLCACNHNFEGVEQVLYNRGGQNMLYV